MYREILKKQDSGNIHEGPNFNCHSLFIYSGIVLTEEQIMAHHDFFIRRYNVDADPVKWFKISRKHIKKQRHEIFTQESTSLPF